MKFVSAEQAVLQDPGRPRKASNYVVSLAAVPTLLLGLQVPSTTAATEYRESAPLSGRAVSADAQRVDQQVAAYRRRLEAVPGGGDYIGDVVFSRLPKSVRKITAHLVRRARHLSMVEDEAEIGAIVALHE